MNHDWRYTLEEQHKFYVKEFDGVLDKPFVHEWFTISTDGWVYIKPEYAWDGATCWPDGPRMDNPPSDLVLRFSNPLDYVRVLTRASLYHDLLYQFMDEIAEAIGLEREDLRKIADLILVVVGEIDGARYLGLVHWGVRTFARGPLVKIFGFVDRTISGIFR